MCTGGACTLVTVLEENEGLRADRLRASTRGLVRLSFLSSPPPGLTSP